MDSIIEKLRKLINHERSAREIGNVEEATAFAAKIQEFVDKYNIELSKISLDIDSNDVRSEVSISECRQRWMKLLLNNIAHLNGCHVVFQSDGYECFGTEIDIELVKMFYEYFAELGVHLQKLAVLSYKMSPEYKRKRKRTRATLTFKDSFGLGYMSALVYRLQMQRAESTRESQALIYIGNKLEKAKNAVKYKVVSNKVTVKRALFRDPAYSRGVAAGRSVALNPKTIGGPDRKELA